MPFSMGPPSGQLTLKPDLDVSYLKVYQIPGNTIWNYLYFFNIATGPGTSSHTEANLKILCEKADNGYENLLLGKKRFVKKKRTTAT